MLNRVVEVYASLFMSIFAWFRGLGDVRKSCWHGNEQAHAIHLHRGSSLMDRLKASTLWTELPRAHSRRKVCFQSAMLGLPRLHLAVVHNETVCSNGGVCHGIEFGK